MNVKYLIFILLVIDEAIIGAGAFAATAPISPVPVASSMPPFSETTLILDADPEIRAVDGKKEVWLKATDGPVKAGELEVIPKGTKFYHWADPESSARWASQGHVDPGEVKALDRGTGMVGGGFYVSSNLWDSNSFGPKLTVFTTTQDVTVITKLEPAVVFSSSLTWENWNKLNEKLASLGVDGVGHYGPDTWFNFVDANPFLNAKAAIWKDVEASDFAKTISADITWILNVNSRIPMQETPWVKSKFPVISQLLHHTLDKSKLDPKVKDQIIQWLINQSSNLDQSALTNSVRAVFTSDVPAVL